MSDKAAPLLVIGVNNQQVSLEGRGMKAAAELAALQTTLNRLEGVRVILDFAPGEIAPTLYLVPALAAPGQRPPVATSIALAGNGSSVQMKLPPDTLAEVLALLVGDAQEIGLHGINQGFKLTVTGGSGEMNWSVEKFGKTRAEKRNAGQRRAA
jgi:hypothetical protein